MASKTDSLAVGRPLEVTHDPIANQNLQVLNNEANVKQRGSPGSIDNRHTTLMLNNEERLPGSN